MAKVREWVTVTPLGRPLAQAAIDLAGLGGEVANESWVPFPSAQDVKLYWIGWQGEETLWGQLLLAIGAIVGVLHRRGPLRPNNPAMTYAELIAQFPLPNSGPNPSVIVKLDAALGAHYRDFLIPDFPASAASATAKRATKALGQ